MGVRVGSLVTKIVTAAAAVLVFTVLIKLLPWPVFCSWAYCWRPALLLGLIGGALLVSSWFVMNKIVNQTIATYE